jgi:hypothetical protein
MTTIAKIDRFQSVVGPQASSTHKKDMQGLSFILFTLYSPHGDFQALFSYI